MESPASFSVPMIQFNANMDEAAQHNGVEWFLYTSSVGVYHPAEVFVEDDVWSTFPSENDWYAGWAKRIGEMNVQAYMKEYDWNKCSIVRPANVYGPNDNFGQWSMVVPSLIKKAMENDVLSVWGDGSPMREFLHVDDLAEACYTCMQDYEGEEHINVGTGEDVTIKELAETIVDVVGYKNDYEWDTSKPNGTPRKVLNVDKIKSLGWEPKISLREGIESTYKWFKENVDV